MHFVWHFVYRGGFQQVAVGAKRAQRRHEEGSANFDAPFAVGKNFVVELVVTGNYRFEARIRFSIRCAHASSPAI